LVLFGGGKEDSRFKNLLFNNVLFLVKRFMYLTSL